MPRVCMHLSKERSPGAHRRQTGQADDGRRPLPNEVRVAAMGLVVVCLAQTAPHLVSYNSIGRMRERERNGRRAGKVAGWPVLATSLTNLAWSWSRPRPSSLSFKAHESHTILRFPTILPRTWFVSNFPSRARSLSPHQSPTK